jgi:hypothetical protein
MMPISAYTHQMLDPPDAVSAGSVVVGANDGPVGANDVVEAPSLVDVSGAVVVVDVCANVEVTEAVVLADVGGSVEVGCAVVVVDIAARAARAAASALARTCGSPYWCMCASAR